MEESRGQVEIMLAAVEETVGGLFGAVMVGGDRTLWLRGRRVIERLSDGSTPGLRWMTEADVRELHAAGAIDDATMDRQLVRVLR